jgi:hypothetical protein
VTLLPYPFSHGHNNSEAFDRSVLLRAQVVGNGGLNSLVLAAQLGDHFSLVRNQQRFRAARADAVLLSGDPNATVPLDAFFLPSADTSGAAGADAAAKGAFSLFGGSKAGAGSSTGSSTGSSSGGLSPDKQQAGVHIEELFDTVAVPYGGTANAVANLRRRLSSAADSAGASASIAQYDTEARLVSIRAAFEAEGKPEMAAGIDATGEVVHRQAQAIAYVLQAAARASPGAAAEAVEGAPRSRIGDGSGSEVVAVMNLGQVGCLQREWLRPQKPDESFVRRPGIVRLYEELGFVPGTLGALAVGGAATWGWRRSGVKGKIAIASVLTPVIGGYLFLRANRHLLLYGSIPRRYLAEASITPPVLDFTKTLD